MCVYIPASMCRLRARSPAGNSLSSLPQLNQKHYLGHILMLLLHIILLLLLHITLLLLLPCIHCVQLVPRLFTQNCEAVCVHVRVCRFSIFSLFNNRLSIISLSVCTESAHHLAGQTVVETSRVRAGPIIKSNPSRCRVSLGVVSAEKHKKERKKEKKGSYKEVENSLSLQSLCLALPTFCWLLILRK